MYENRTILKIWVLIPLTEKLKHEKLKTFYQFYINQ